MHQSLYDLLTFYDVRWESSPWTACSTSCGGGIQSRSVSCVEEDMQGIITLTEEWKCLYSPKTAILQPCNTYDCPTWLAQEWSPVGPLCFTICCSHPWAFISCCKASEKPCLNSGAACFRGRGLPGTCIYTKYTFEKGIPVIFSALQMSSSILNALEPSCSCKVKTRLAAWLREALLTPPPVSFTLLLWMHRPKHTKL